MSYKRAKIKIIFFLSLSCVTLNNFADTIPVYISTHVDCYDALYNVGINVKEKVKEKKHTYTLLNKEELLTPENSNDSVIYKKIATINYQTDYPTDTKKKIGFKVDGASKGIVFTFDKSKKELVLDNDKSNFNFTIKSNKVDGVIKNEKDKIIISLQCNTEA